MQANIMGDHLPVTGRVVQHLDRFARSTPVADPMQGKHLEFKPLPGLHKMHTVHCRQVVKLFGSPSLGGIIRTLEDMH